MRLLSRYIAYEIAAPAFLALVIFAFIGAANELRERAQYINMSQVNVGDFARLTFWFMPTLIYYVVPMTYLMGIMLAFGRLAQNNEITAIQAAGIPLKRAVLPVIAGGAVLSVACFLIQDRVQPMALKQINNLIYTEMPKRASMELFTPGVMHTLGNWKVYIGERDRATSALKNVDILETMDNGEIKLYHADSAEFSKVNGRAQIRIPKGFIYMSNIRARIPNDFILLAPDPETQRIPDARRAMNINQLLAEDIRLRREITVNGEMDDVSPLYGAITQLPRGVSYKDYQNLRNGRTEMSERLSLPLACLAFSIVAAPLAIRGGQAGKSYGFAVGLGICLLYYLLTMTTKPPALCSLELSIALGNIPNIVLGIVGAVALWRVDRI